MAEKTDPRIPHCLQQIRRSREIRAIAEVARKLGTRAFIVGGPLRDLLLGKRIVDNDIAVESNAWVFGERLSRMLGGKFTFYPEFGTGTVTLADHRHIDLAQTRTEVYPQPAALPKVAFSDLSADLKRRDFTINALAWDLSDCGMLVDPFDGLSNLRRRVVRVLHERSFDDDPTRIFRAVRFSCRLGFRIEPTTSRLIGQAIARGRLKLLSGKRVLTELELIVKEPEVVTTLLELNRREVFRSLFGRRIPDSRLKNLHQFAGSEPELFLAYLLSLLARPERLPLTRSMRTDISSLRAFSGLRRRLGRATRASAVYSLLRHVSENALRISAGLESAGLGRKIREYLTHYRHIEPTLRGADLRAAGVAPGAIYTEILERLRAARLDGEVQTRTEAKAWLQRFLQRQSHTSRKRGMRSAPTRGA